MAGNAIETSKRDTGVGRLITALGIAQICSWGTLYYSFALMAEAMRTDLGWPKTEIYGAATLGLTLAGVAAYPVGAAIDRGQGRYVMSLASVGAGLMLFAWSQVSNVLAFYAIFAAALFPQVGEGVFCYMDSGKDVDLEDGPDLFFFQLFDSTIHAISGVVDNDVDVAKGGDGLFYRAADGVGTGQIYFQRKESVSAGHAGSLFQSRH